MIRLHIVVEGQTEEAFVNEVLAPVLGIVQLKSNWVVFRFPSVYHPLHSNNSRSTTTTGSRFGSAARRWSFTSRPIASRTLSSSRGSNLHS